MNNLRPEKITRPVLVLVGPTAIGKTELSLKLGETFNCEIISVDSMQVYRYMDIGTAKIPDAERRSIPHHLIDIVNPDEQYDAMRFTKDCLQAINDIHGRSAIPLLTGGTGLYLRALKNGFFQAAPNNPEVRAALRARLQQEGVAKLHDELRLYDCISAKKIHPNDTYRTIRALEVFISTGIPLSAHQQQQTVPPASFCKMLTIGLSCDRPTLYRRINLRTVNMIERGFEEEVRRLLGMGYLPELKSMQAIGYRHMLNYISGKWSKAELTSKLAQDTRRYAKRQYTWFNRDPSIFWFSREDERLVISAVTNWLQKN